MKKNTVKIILGVVVLLLLIGGTALLMMPSDNQGNATTPTPVSDYTTYTIFSEPVDNVKAVEVGKNDGNITAVKDNEGNWLINALALGDIDSSKSRRFAEAAINLTTIKLITENAND